MKKTLIALALSLSIACASAELNSYKVLGTTEVAVDTAMKAYADLVVAGKISQATQDKVRKDFGIYQTVMTDAKVVYDTYKLVGGPYPAAKINSAIAAGAVVVAEAK